MFHLKRFLFLITLLLLFLFSLSLFSKRNNKIEIRVLKGEKVVFGKWGKGPGQFGLKWEEGWLPVAPYDDPQIDKEGNVYILDQINVKVHKFSNDGNFTLSFSFSRSNYGIGGFAVGKKGNIYVGDQVYSTEGKLRRRIPLFTDNRNTFLIFGIDEQSNLMVKDVDRQVQYIITDEGEIIRKGEPHYIFTPINGKDYSVSSGPRKGSDKKDFILKIYDSREKLSENGFLLEDSLMSDIRPQRLIPMKISRNGDIIVVGMRQVANLDYIVFYINEDKGEIVKAYVLPSDSNPLIDENPPVFGLDGNIYQSGFSAKEDDPSYGGYWVKKYILPEEDKPR